MAFIHDSGIITDIERDDLNGIWRLHVTAPLEREGIILEPEHHYDLSVFGDLSPGWLDALPYLKGLELVFHGHLRNEEVPQSECGRVRPEVAVLGMGLTPHSLLALRKLLNT